MSEFLTAILAFPTVVFTILLGMVVLYWLFVLLGALDIDVLDFADADGDGDADGFGGVIEALGLGGVPVMLSLSLLILGAWGICLLAMELAGGLGLVGAGLAAGVAVAALLVAVPVTSFAVRPLRRLFVTHPAPESRSLVGKICTVTTLKVDERYGQAELEDGGAGLLIQVRYSGSGRLGRGDKAVIFDYKDEIFLVAPLDEALQKSLQGLG
jgi:hypothetical protein